MRNSIMLVILFVCSNKAQAQSFAGFEQYFYANKNGLQLVVPVIYFQNEHDWYIESAINYEQLHTVSLYAGKTFSDDEEFSYSITPMVGAVLGSLKGAVLGLNTMMKYKNFLFASQSHYTFSFKNIDADLLYSWMELGYQVTAHTVIGFSIQNTVFNATDMKLEPGVFIKFSVKKWNFPIYFFNPVNENRYLILGIAREFALPAKKRSTMQSANHRN